MHVDANSSGHFMNPSAGIVRSVRASVLGVAVTLAPFVSATAQKPIPVRSLTAAVSSDSGVFTAIGPVRALAAGGVLVGDFWKRRVILFDSTLSKFSVVLDNNGTAGGRYGDRPAQLFPFLGDSTVFVDLSAQALLVIAPNGTVARVMALPNARDLNAVNNPSGTPGFDLKGRMIYRSIRSTRRVSNEELMSHDSGTITMEPVVDSAPILRADPESRTTDTIGMLKIAASRTGWYSLRRGIAGITLLNPLQFGDEWTVLADGTVAVVRSVDYHIDWIHPDGTTTSTPKMPFDWRRITQEDKVRMLDSIVKFAEDLAAHPPPGEEVYKPLVPYRAVEPEDLPDFYPPVRPDQVKADPDGNVWILPTTSKLSTPSSPGLVYDVVNRAGEIVERVRLPENRVLAAIGPGGVVYMKYVMYTPGHSVQRIERAKVIR